VGDVVMDLGDTQPFQVTASDIDGDALSYDWEVDGSPVNGATASNMNYTPAAAGLHSVTVIVTDGYGGFTSHTWNVTVEGDNANLPPQIDSGPDANPNPAQTGETVTFTVSASDGDGDPLTYAWNFGDGSSGSGASPSHAYAADGTYTAKVTVSDGQGGTATGTVTVVVGGSSVVYGDANLDGAFGPADINLFIDWLLGRATPPAAGETAFVAADVNGDGKLDPADINLMIDRILGRIDKFPVED
jgi:PKD repeat protein